MRPKVDECHCPFCDQTLFYDPLFCKACEIELEYCEDCNKPIPKNEEKCPFCGVIKERDRKEHRGE